jgi:ribonucleoside-diphosphate reductase alpha chain
MRQRLPDDRESVTRRFVVRTERGIIKCYLIVGLYDDGSPGEIFVRVGKEGSSIGSMLDQWAIAISMLLQHGVELEAIVSKFSWASFAPSGWVDGSGRCKSLVDLIARWLGERFGDT